MGSVGGQGVKVLEALAEGRPFRRSGDGWNAGGLNAPAAVMGELARAALVREDGGTWVLTAAGRLRVAKGRPTRPKRLLVERPLPEDAPSPTGKPRRSVTVNALESPLGWLRARGLVDQRQFDAGERLRGDWTMAELGPRVTMRWDPTPAGSRGPGGAIDPTLAGIAAKRRFDGAIEAAGKGLGDVLWRVVCAGEGLEAAEAALGWPKRAGKLVLLMALDRVADYYGIR